MIFQNESQTAFLKLVQSSAARKAEAEKRLNYYYDRQSDELARIVAQRWSNPADFRLFIINIVKKVIDKRAMIYRTPPARVFEGWSQDQGDALYRSMAADTTMKKANRMVRLCRTSLLRVGWNGSGPTLSVLTPNILDVVAPDPESPEKIVVTHKGSRADLTEYSIWTATGYERVDFKGRALPLRDNPEGVNPYGVIPFVPLFDRAPDDEFFLPGGDDLIESQDAVNVALVNLWRAIELQSHGQAWAKGLDPSEAIKSGPDRTIIVPTDGSFGYAQPNTPISSVLEGIEFVIRQVAVTNDLPPEIFDLNRKSLSGSAKLQESRDIVEVRQDDVELWRVYETRLFQVLKAVVNTHQPGTIPVDARLRIDFGEPIETLNEGQRLENAQRRVAMGIWSPVDALMHDNSDIKTREEAAAILEQRAAETRRFSPLADLTVFGTPSS